MAYNKGLDKILYMANIEGENEKLVDVLPVVNSYLSGGQLEAVI